SYLPGESDCRVTLNHRAQFGRTSLKRKRRIPVHLCLRFRLVCWRIAHSHIARSTKPAGERSGPAGFRDVDRQNISKIFSERNFHSWLGFDKLGSCTKKSRLTCSPCLGFLLPDLP